MRETFGKMLRRLRRAQNLTMGDVARHLGLSVSYISDVERGKRQPFRDSIINHVATFLDVAVQELTEAAAISRGTFELGADVSDYGLKAGASLARSWANFDDEDYRRLEELANELASKSKGQG